jgi:isocitrate/isopropylmalate dehydrogenase
LEILHYFQAHGLLEVTGPWPIGASSYLENGTGLPPSTVKACEEADAVLFGAVGDHPGFSGGGYRPESSLIFLREHFDLRISIRQIWQVGAEPLTIIRNLLGGAYGSAEMRTESEGILPATDKFQLSAEQVIEVLEIASDYTKRTGQPLISVDKANLLATSRLWRLLAKKVSALREVPCQHLYIDRCAFELARFGLPKAVIVTEGLFGDILSDLAAGVAGSIALCSSASVHPGAPLHGKCRGLFEPVHGTAPDIAGKDIANPTGAYLALASLLEWLEGTAPLADSVRSAVRQILSTGPLTADMKPSNSPPVGTRAFSNQINEIICQSAV